MTGQSWTPASRDTPLSDDVGRALLARRVVLVHGAVGDAAAGQLAAMLMMLDAAGDERIVVRMTGATSTLECAMSLMDVLAVVGVPVDMVGGGTISGGAVGVFAMGRRRLLSAHARLHLHEPDVSVSGRATEIERTLAAADSLRDRFFERLATSTRRPLSHVAGEWGAGTYLDAADAVTLGYADGVESAAGRGPRDTGDGAHPAEGRDAELGD
ncbi:MAG: ATP-dependent Clp protease proteolytic subunit [Acidimicrobiales bacterium]